MADKKIQALAPTTIAPSTRAQDMEGGWAWGGVRRGPSAPPAFPWEAYWGALGSVGPLYAVLCIYEKQLKGQL